MPKKTSPDDLPPGYVRVRLDRIEVLPQVRVKVGGLLNAPKGHEDVPTSRKRPST